MLMLNEIASLVPRYYRYAGWILNSANSGLSGHGIANIVIFRKLAKIDFIIQITTSSTSSTFQYGINRDILQLSAGVPIITPVNSGTLQYFRNGSLVTSLMGYGGTLEARSQFWTPARIYTTDGKIGSWPETQFQVGDILSGACYGTVVE